jgi:hypothetical protein
MPTRLATAWERHPRGIVRNLDLGASDSAACSNDTHHAFKEHQPSCTGRPGRPVNCQALPRCCGHMAAPPLLSELLHAMLSALPADPSVMMCPGGTQVGHSTRFWINPGEKYVLLLACREQPGGGVCNNNMPYALSIKQTLIVIDTEVHRR